MAAKAWGPRFATQTLGLSKAPVALWRAAEPAEKLTRKMPSFSHFDSVHPLGVPDNVPIKRKRMLNLTAIKTAKPQPKRKRPPTSPSLSF